MLSRLLIIIISLTSFLVQADEITAADLQTPIMNGCSGVPNGSWKQCCDEHDLLYWAGGSFLERKIADERLYSCMEESGGPGFAYYSGVRAGGLQFWSKAWPGRNIVPNSDLTRAELQEIEDEHELWVLLGRPTPYDFVALESLKHPELTTRQKMVLRQKFSVYSQKEEYQSFLRIYKKRMGEPPLTEAF